MAGKQKRTLVVGDREVSVSSPDKIYFPEIGITKLQLVEYYLAVGDAALRGIHSRPLVLKRYVHGAAGEFFFQKRAPKNRPEWVETVTLQYPSGRSADEVVVTELAQLVWITNLGNIDLNPHSTRADDLDRPDELRVDLDPGPAVTWADVRDVAMVVRDVLDDHGLVGYPKTSGSKGMHIHVRIARQWPFDDVRLAALALAREVEARTPDKATSRWWKEQRHGVFVDYNQNARDRTVASAYSVRPRPDARVSTPLWWNEVPDCDPAAFTIATVPGRYKTLGDPSADIDSTPGSIDSLLELAAQQGDDVRPAPEIELRTVAKAARQQDAVDGLERWKARWSEAAAHLRPEDVLVDSMRGRSTTWTRIRVKLSNVPGELHPPVEPPDPDYDPWRR